MAGELAAIARLLEMDERAAAEAFTDLLPGRGALTLKSRGDGTCVFLEGADCRVQAAKPLQCRGFPNAWNFPGWRDMCKAVPAAGHSHSAVIPQNYGG